MAPSTRRPALAWALVVVLLAAGCGRAERGTMVSIPPPRNWAENLARFRAERDRFFGSSPDTPLWAADVADFQGLEYWEPDPALYFVGPIQAYASPERLTVITTAGGERPAEKYGWIRFPLQGRPQTLQVYRLLDLEPRSGVEGLFLAFYDETSGKETYPAGRYLDLLGQPGGPYVLDFNLAFNPSCAYGDPTRFACPRAPAENRLSARIEAGERGYKHGAAGDQQPAGAPS